MIRPNRQFDLDPIELNKSTGQVEADFWLTEQIVDIELADDSTVSLFLEKQLNLTIVFRDSRKIAEETLLRLRPVLESYASKRVFESVTAGLSDRSDLTYRTPPLRNLNVLSSPVLPSTPKSKWAKAIGPLYTVEGLAASLGGWDASAHRIHGKSERLIGNRN